MWENLTKTVLLCFSLKTCISDRMPNEGYIQRAKNCFNQRQSGGGRTDRLQRLENSLASTSNYILQANCVNWRFLTQKWPFVAAHGFIFHTTTTPTQQYFQQLLSIERT